MARTHGLGGELSFSFTDDIFHTTHADYLFLMVDGLLVPFFIEDYRFASDTRAFVKFSGVDNVKQASPLVNAEVFFPRALTTDSEEISLEMLLGYTISDSTTHSTTSPIAHLDSSTANPLFVLTDGTLIPIATEWIKDIDHERRIIHMALPDGLLAL